MSDSLNNIETLSWPDSGSFRKVLKGDKEVVQQVSSTTPQPAQ